MYVVPCKVSFTGCQGTNLDEYRTEDIVKVTAHHRDYTTDRMN